ncbi:MAG: urea carboxylase-associated family protein [Chthoniobacter sp.]|nr:urea carboxylase-associated family protein [Chthoniobacter sp.]
MSLIEPSLVRFEEVVPPGSNWSHVLKRGTTLRITDTTGDANVSALLYNFELLSERLNLPDTLKCQHTARLTKGHCLYSDMGRILVSITDDTCGWHDPLAGWSTAKIVEQKYGAKTYQEARNAWHRNAHDNFVTELGKYGMDERDLAMNVNFFSKVSVSGEGRLNYVPDNSRAGAYIDLRSEMNTLVILNTCIHPLDTSPTYAPQPVKLTVWTSPPPASDDFCRNSRPENQRGFTLTERYFL